MSTQVTGTRSMKKKFQIQLKSGSPLNVNEDKELRRQLQQTCGCPLWQIPKDYRQFEIGYGKFSRVHLIDHPEKRGIKVVAKVIQGDTKSERTRNLFVKEMKIGTGVEHPNLVRFLAYWDCPLTVYLEYVGFDWNDYGVEHTSHDLVNFLSTMHKGEVVETFHTETDLFQIVISDIVSGLDYLHGMNIAHRDLKPLNILISNSETDILEGEERIILCKITDFGESRSYFANTSAITTTNAHGLERGTTPFMSPELLEGDYDSRNIDALKQIDIWAFGMIIFCILNPDIEYPFFSEQSQAETETGSSLGQEKFKAIMKKAFMQGKIPPAGSDEYIYLADEMPVFEMMMKHCLTNNPAARPTTKAIKQKLESNVVAEGVQIPGTCSEGTPEQVSDYSMGAHGKRRPSTSHMHTIDGRRNSTYGEEIISELKTIKHNTSTLISLQMANSPSQGSFGSPVRERSFAQATPDSDTVVEQVSETLSEVSIDGHSPPRARFQVGAPEAQQLEIQRIWTILHNSLHPQPVVMELFTRGQLSHTEKELIQSEKSRHQQVDRLLSVIYQKDESVFQSLIEALPNTNQSYLADRISGVAEFEDPPHVALLAKYHIGLVRGMCDIETITDYLFSKLLITQQQMEVIRSKPTDTEKAEILLDIVRTFSSGGFSQFIEILQCSQNDHLTDLFK